MRPDQAEYLRDFLIKKDLTELLELGFFQGKSTAYMAAVLEELGRGHITALDREAAKRRKPNIETVLAGLDLAHRVTRIYAERSFTWELCKLLEQKPRPSFDFCYIDGAHTWDGTGFSFLLVDILLRPGGWVIFDDLDWTIASSPAAAKNPKTFQGYPEEERQARQVRKVWELLVTERGYVNCHEKAEFQWGIAQKPE